MSKRNSREGKARRRAERGNPRNEHLDPNEDLTRCRYPGCRKPWTMEINRADGYTAFVCEPHGLVLIGGMRW